MSSYTIPNVIAQHPRGERIMDVYSHLLTERIVYLGTPIDSGVANTLIAQLLHLEADSAEQEINLCINCEGGDLPPMLAVYDTMQFIQASVATTCVGQAIGVGAVPLAAGTAGRRAVLPHARVVLHQPAARGQGPIPDLILQADELVRMRADMEAILSRHTGQSVQTLRTDTDRDRVLTAGQRWNTGSWITCSGSGFRTPSRPAPQPPREPRPSRRASEHDWAGLISHDGAVLAPQIACDLLRQPGQGDAECPRESRDHFARRFLPAALDLGQILRRYPGPAGRVRYSFLPVQAEGVDALTERFPP